MNKRTLKKVFPFSKVILSLLLTASLFIVFIQAMEEKKVNDSKDNFLLSNYSDRIKSTVSSSLNILYVLESLVLSTDGNLTDAQFLEICKEMRTDLLSCVALIPNGIVGKVYPYEENKAALGLNILEDELTSIDALLTLNTSEIIFSGPYNLKQGGLGITARKPIFDRNSETKDFWGFVSIVLDPVKLLDDLELSTIEKIDCKYRLKTNYNNKSIILGQSDGFQAHKQKRIFFSIGANKWEFGLHQVNATRTSLIRTIFLACFLFTASFFIYNILKTSEKRHMKLKIQSYLDPLTKVYNRRMYDNYTQYEETDKDKGDFTLFYIDLNDFKPVNDNFGHETGDNLLILYTKRLRENLKKEDLVIRMGGDEFAILIEKSLSHNDIGQIINRIERISQEIFLIDNTDIKISASIGHALFPEDANTLADLLSVADERMYLNKRNKKERKTSQILN